MFVTYSKDTQLGKQKEKPKNAFIKPGKKTKEWNATRATLKKRFAAAGIMACEIRFGQCTGTQALSFAHVDKRRNLRSGELECVALACLSCHGIIEKWPSQRMRMLIENIIKSRKVQP